MWCGQAGTESSSHGHGGHGAGSHPSGPSRTSGVGTGGDHATPSPTAVHTPVEQISPEPRAVIQVRERRRRPDDVVVVVTDEGSDGQGSLDNSATTG